MSLSYDTETVAELFARQGQPGRAAAIYRKLLRDGPNDEQRRARLTELEALEKKGKTMGFREMIQEVVENTPGAIACTLMGYDGIAIDTYTVGGAEFDLETLMVNYSAIAKLGRQAKDDHPVGEMREVEVANERATILIRPLTDEYFLASVLEPTSIAGRARFHMRVAAPALTKELT